jgi:hypothetical protein
VSSVVRRRVAGRRVEAIWRDDYDERSETTVVDVVFNEAVLCRPETSWKAMSFFDFHRVFVIVLASWEATT